MLKWALKRESFDSFICSLLLLFYYMGTFGVIGRVKIILRPEHLSQWNKITSRFFGQATLESDQKKKSHSYFHKAMVIMAMVVGPYLPEVLFKQGNFVY